MYTIVSGIALTYLPRQNDGLQKQASLGSNGPSGKYLQVNLN